MNKLPHLGTREDPHAQAREARRLPLLLHSMSVFREIFEIIFANREIVTVVEVGVESGQVSTVYAELGASTVYCVDPNPAEELRATLAKSPKLHLVEKASPAVLAELPLADLYVLDGDHNYAVVHAELSWILANAPDAVVAMHDLLWPCSRRDLYYEPSVLPAEQRHDSSPDGPTVWHDELSPAGFVGAGAFTMAHEAGGERNGVLTAVEDVLSLADNEGWLLEVVPVVFGMGLLMHTTSPGAEKIVESLRPYTTSRLLAAMENNRIALFTRVLQLQYEAVAHADDADRLAAVIAEQRHQIEQFKADLAAEADQRARDVAALQRDNDRLRELLSHRFRPRLAATLRRWGKSAEPRVRKALHQ